MFDDENDAKVNKVGLPLKIELPEDHVVPSRNCS